MASYNFYGGNAGTVDLSSLIKEEGWKRELKKEFEKDYFRGIGNKLAKDYANGTAVFPPTDLIFHAFNLTPFDEVKVVILGQDPYYNVGKAMGLAFSVPNGVPIPLSLQKIYQALSNDDQINFTPPMHGNLEVWAKRGVFLLNATLTVEADDANSHAKYGWQTFTDRVIKSISDNKSGVVFILMGEDAKNKSKLIDKTKHHVIPTPHPAYPGSKNPTYLKFEDCKCFSMADDALFAYKGYKMNWSL